MIRYTSKEYKEGFDIKMSEYLLAFEDNTHLSFLDLQKELFTSFRDALLSIANELKKFGEQEAKNIFLSNTVFIDLKNISNEIYRDIRLEEKFQFANYRFKTLLEELDDINSDPENFCTRIDYNKLKNHIISVGRILDFLAEQSLKYQSTSSLVSEDTSQNKDESPEIETNVIIDPGKQLIDKHLSPYSASLSVDDYNVLTKSLLVYFETGNFPKLEKKINFRHLNKKFIGWALKEIYKSFRTDKLPIELFRFAQQNINLFEKEVIVEDNFHNSSFYKSFTTRPHSYKYPNTP